MKPRSATPKAPRKELLTTAKTHWPFTRMDPKLLERAHRQAIKPQPQLFEEAPF
jgi:hypothetical protein